MSKIKNIAVLGTALALGGAGVYTANEHIKSTLAEEKRILAEQHKKEELSVVVPSVTLGKGETILEEHLSLRRIPVEFVHSDSVRESNYVEALGQRLLYPVEAGKPLLWAHLELGKNGTFSSLLENGRRALTISVDEINSLSGFLQPDDKVDLFLTYSNNGNRTTRLLMQKLRVIATGTMTRSPEDGSQATTNYGTLTVDVTPQEAERLIYAQSAGSITATLQNPESAPETIKTASTNMNNLFGEKPKKKRRVVRKRDGIEYIIGGVR
ncbi:MAG: Flp pilus assembly protein CpaB [Granulosicoccaceae bacterium]